MSETPFQIRTLLDASVPDSVGKMLTANGHVVIHHREVLPERTPDEVVCATAVHNDAILVAIDGDMKDLAKRYGITPRNEDRFTRLSVIHLCCGETQAAHRLGQALSLIEHEWRFSQEKNARRMWIDVGAHFLRTHR